ncbi:MAG: hypothetical protein ABSC32_09470 [Steroidobacteraceae bacterium]
MQLKTFIECAGWLAMVLILGAYALVTTGKLHARSALYQWMNIVGAVGFIINSGWYKAWPSAWLNVIWLGIGIYGVRRSRRAA